MIDLSHDPFFIFGCGNRRKLILTPHGLSCWPANESVIEFSASQIMIDSEAYTATIDTEDGSRITVSEDEHGVWSERKGQRECLAESDIILPSFDGHPQRKLLRVLHHEILVNIVDGKPLPNFLVYDKPWYRDAAMMAMVLEHTDNLSELDTWISSLTDPFDRNNAGHEEPDNLGQVLYMVSLVSDASHPIVKTVLNASRHITRNKHLTGLTDNGERPVYQTKWLKFGLDQLGLADDFVIPKTEDRYAPLFWWDKNDIILSSSTRYHAHNELYPYLTWAEAHFWGDPPPMKLAAADYPLTWEASASEADYSGMRMIDEGFVEKKLSMPHTWHAAEMFLYFYRNSQHL